NRVLNSVAELMKDDLRVFGVVNSAEPERDAAIVRAVPRVVLVRSVGVNCQRLAEDRAAPAIPERFQIPDRSIYVKIGHHFFEGAVVASEIQIPIGQSHAAAREVCGNSATVKRLATSQGTQSDANVRTVGRQRKL